MDAVYKKTTSIERILFLLNLLSNRCLSKDEIISEFRKRNLEISKKTIESYLEILKLNSCNLKIKKEKNKNFYFIEKPQTIIKLTKKEFEAISQAKKLLYFEKDYNVIRQAMALFYRLALHLESYQEQFDMINFGYFSSLNWGLVSKLEEHCKNKDIIIIDYILPENKNKFIRIHADSIFFSQTSKRLYLRGVIDNTAKFSKLPLDRIFMVERVVKKHVRFNLEFDILEYKISKKTFREYEKDPSEFIAEEKGDVITIKRPLDDYFEIVQKILSYGSDLYYISDERIKDSVLEKLRAIRMNYNGEL